MYIYLVLVGELRFVEYGEGCIMIFKIVLFFFR